MLSVGKKAMVFLEEVESWEVSDPEEQLQKLIHFMQILSQKTPQKVMTLGLTYA